MIPKDVPFEVAPSWTILEKFKGASRAHVRARQNAAILDLPYFSSTLMLPPPRDVAELEGPDQPRPGRKVVAVCKYTEEAASGSWRQRTEWYAVTIIRADAPGEAA